MLQKFFFYNIERNVESCIETFSAHVAIELNWIQSLNSSSFFQLRVYFSLGSLLDELPDRAHRKLKEERPSPGGKLREVGRANYSAI